jgi:putative ABC transport system ATP-binding protein
MIQPLIEAVDIVKVLGSGAGQVQALKGVSLALQGKELTLLMGPSGSGKTTLLSVLGCMLSPTEGTVRVLGQSTQGLAAEELAEVRRKNIGFIFQSYHLFPTLNVRDNIQLVLDVRGERSAAAVSKAKDALATVGLAHKAAALPRELSGGEQQRVAIARAIVSNPSVLLADEPTSALDRQNGEVVMTILAQIAKQSSRGVLIVTHDPRMLPFADRIIRIEDGRIIGEDRDGARLHDLAEV